VHENTFNPIRPALNDQEAERPFEEIAGYNPARMAYCEPGGLLPVMHRVVPPDRQSRPHPLEHVQAK